MVHCSPELHTLFYKINIRTVIMDLAGMGGGLSVEQLLGTLVHPYGKPFVTFTSQEQQPTSTQSVSFWLHMSMSADVHI